MKKLVYVVPDLTKCKIGEDYTKSEWYQIPEELKKTVTSISKGSDVGFESKEEGGKKVLVSIKVTGSGDSQEKKAPISQPTTNAKSTTGFTCKKCGKPMKNGDYDTCFTCNQEIRKQEESSPEGKAKQRSIEVQAMFKAAANVVGASIAGQVNFSEEGQAQRLAEFVSIVAKGLLVEYDKVSN